MNLEKLPITNHGQQRAGLIPTVNIPYSLLEVFPLIEFNNVGQKHPSIIRDIEQSCKDATGYKWANNCTRIYGYAGSHISFPYHVHIVKGENNYDWRIDIYSLNGTKVIFSLSGKNCSDKYILDIKLVAEIGSFLREETDKINKFLN